MDNNKKDKVWLYIFIAIFGLLGIYFTFFQSNTLKYSSKVKAYKVDENKYYSEGSTLYSPVYYYKVKGKDYKCEAKYSSSIAPKKSETTVYYDYKNPEKCMIQYQKKTSNITGIVFFVIMLVLAFFAFKKHSTKQEESIQDKKTNTGNDKKGLYLFFIIFGAIGIYLTFFHGNTFKYDSKTNAYRIDNNMYTDSEGDTMYSPVYYYRVNGEKYECHTKGSSNSTPKESEKTVYYNSKNPEKCMTQYEKSSSKTIGIIFLAVTGIVLFLSIKFPPSNTQESYQSEEINYEKQQQIEENAEKTMIIVDKIQLIIKRVILGIIILIMFVFLLIDTAIMKQTIKARNYIDVVAVYVDNIEKDEDSIFDDYLYTFKDKDGIDQEIVVSVSRYDVAEDEIKIKYNENNPQDFYEEGMTFETSGIIWYVIKIVIMILLIILFFHKKLLSKIGFSIYKS